MIPRFMGMLQTAGFRSPAADLSRFCTQIICPALAAPQRLYTASTLAFSDADTNAPSSSSTYPPTPPPGPPDTCKIQVIMKAFELRYIQEASTVIRDLMLINIAPKSRNFIPTNQRSWPSDETNLVIPISDVHIPTRLPKYTVLRSPHVDKKSREQFEKKVHKRCITVPTTSRHEMQSLLDSILTYDFTGVQLQINITHNTYLQPASQEIRYGEVLSQHRQKNQELFELGDLRYSNKGQSRGEEETLMAKMDAATAAIANPVVRHRVRELVDSINEVLLKLKLGTTVDDDAIVDAVGRILRADGTVDMLQLQAVVKYGLFCRKLSEMLRDADESSSTAVRLKDVFQAVSVKLLEPSMQQQQQQQQRYG